MARRPDPRTDHHLGETRLTVLQCLAQGKRVYIDDIQPAPRTGGEPMTLATFDTLRTWGYVELATELGRPRITDLGRLALKRWLSRAQRQTARRSQGKTPQPAIRPPTPPESDEPTPSMIRAHAYVPPAQAEYDANPIQARYNFAIHDAWLRYQNTKRPTTGFYNMLADPAWAEYEAAAQALRTAARRNAREQGLPFKLPGSPDTERFTRTTRMVDRMDKETFRMAHNIG